MRRITIVTTTLLMAATTLVSAAPASAGSPCNGSSASVAPDGRIKLDDGEGWTGIDVYGESALQTSLPDDVATFTMRWRNNTSAMRKIRVLWAGEQVAGYATKYFVNGVNVTNDVKHVGRIGFALIPPGGSTPALELVVKNRGTDPSVAGFEIDTAHTGLFKGSQPPACDLLSARVDVAEA
jgi:hypothetical protein